MASDHPSVKPLRQLEQFDIAVTLRTTSALCLRCRLRPSQARGLCCACWAWARRRGLLDVVGLPRHGVARAKTCSFPGCGGRHRSHGLCDMHLRRWMYRCRVQNPWRRETNYRPGVRDPAARRKARNAVDEVLKQEMMREPERLRAEVVEAFDRVEASA